jgi:hypothetical protein
LHSIEPIRGVEKPRITDRFQVGRKDAWRLLDTVSESKKIGDPVWIGELRTPIASLISASIIADSLVTWTSIFSYFLGTIGDAALAYSKTTTY